MMANEICLVCDKPLEKDQAQQLVGLEKDGITYTSNIHKDCVKDIK